jgi:hypothetical protein
MSPANGSGVALSPSEMELEFEKTWSHKMENESVPYFPFVSGLHSAYAASSINIFMYSTK